MKDMLKHFFSDKQRKEKKRNSREGVASYLNKKPRKLTGRKSVKGSPMSLQQVYKFGSNISSNSVTKCI